MDNEFKYNYASVLTAYSYSAKAKLCAEEMMSALEKVNSLASSVNINGLSSIYDSKIKEQLENVVNFESNLGELKNEVIYDLVMSGDFNPVAMLQNGTITIDDLVSISSEYILQLVKNNPDYYNNLSLSDNPVRSLLNLGLTESDIQKINQAFCNNLIEKDLMYTGEGVAEMGLLFTGFLAMFGIKQNYQLGGFFDADSHGLYLGTKESDLATLDCCNYYDFLCRSAGINASGYNAREKWKYSGYSESGANYYVDNYTGEKIPITEVHVGSDSEYFYNASSGDILTTAGDDMDHIRVIVSNDGKGYYTTESSSRYSGTVVKYYTYEELANDGYYVTNMDDFYSNVTKEWRISANTDDGGYNYLTPTDISSQVKLDDAHTAALIEQFNKRNKNPNVASASLIDITDGSTISSKSTSFLPSDRSTNANTGGSSNNTGGTYYSGNYSSSSTSTDTTSTSSDTKVVNLNDEITSWEQIYPRKSINTNTNSSSNDTKVTETVTNVTNNYYYGNSSNVSNLNNTVDTNTVSVPIVPEIDIPISDTIEVVDNIDKEIVSDIDTSTNTNTSTNKVITPYVSTTTTTSNDTSIMPTIGAVLGIGAAAAAGKVLYDKYKDKEDKPKEEEPVKKVDTTFGFGTNFEGASELKTSDDYYYKPDSAEDYYEE